MSERGELTTDVATLQAEVAATRAEIDAKQAEVDDRQTRIEAKARANTLMFNALRDVVAAKSIEDAQRVAAGALEAIETGQY